ncbi:hypothetical protein POWCR01_000222300 [Plasmodium ovale]|nr:hypothetical protein POWCR01_000222300 [Plasmodium ovale]
MELCTKLLRNLWSVSNHQSNSWTIAENCKKLNSWLFYQMKPHMITEVLEKIFHELERKPTEFPITNKCFYYPYSKNVNEPEKIIKLEHFVDNISTIKNTLEEGDPSKYCLCKRYVYECIDIYKEFNEKYCNGAGDKNIKTCEKVTTFFNTYEGFLPGEPKISKDTKVLIFTEKEYLGKCAPNVEERAVMSVAGNNSRNGDSTVVGGVTGTLVGTCFSLLALYKFSPFGPMLRSRLQSWNRKNSVLDKEKEFSIDGTGNHNTYSDDMEYHIQYNSL